MAVATPTQFHPRQPSHARPCHQQRTTTSTSANIGSSITVSNTETNQGDVAATSHSIKFYLSTDNQIDSSDLALGVRNLSTLAVGASSATSTKLTLPKTTPPGDYYLGAVADSASTQTENDKTNQGSTRNSLFTTNRPRFSNQLRKPSQLR